MRQIDNMRCRVFMPLGHTMLHFPQSIQLESIEHASFSFPRCNATITLRRLIPENRPAGQDAPHEPQAIHFRTSGSRAHSISNLSKSRLSRLTAELGAILKPKSIISALKYNYELQARQIRPRQEFPEPSSVPCRHRHRKYLPSARILHPVHCQRF